MFLNIVNIVFLLINKEENERFNLNNYLNAMISEQINVIQKDKKNNNKHVKLCINELITHCKQSGMTDKFIHELKQCYKQNPYPHSLIDLQSIHKITYVITLEYFIIFS